mmetsp:Transcript_29069/g.65892  ORF Transcript_29069/g.65892 Transcript_29069/m.65892 type:complete len:113 (+) Transcript_29069:206-544(+)
MIAQYQLHSPLSSSAQEPLAGESGDPSKLAAPLLRSSDSTASYTASATSSSSSTTRAAGIQLGRGSSSKPEETRLSITWPPTSSRALSHARLSPCGSLGGLEAGRGRGRASS